MCVCVCAGWRDSNHTGMIRPDLLGLCQIPSMLMCMSSFLACDGARCVRSCCVVCIRLRDMLLCVWWRHSQHDQTSACHDVQSDRVCLVEGWY